MSEEIVLGGVYQHYKGMNYLVHDLVRHSETLEWMVLYECLYENPKGKFWVRPKGMFLELIDVSGEQRPRFMYIGDKKGRSRL